MLIIMHRYIFLIFYKILKNKIFFQELYADMKASGETRTFHGAGSRYNEKVDGSDSIVSKCFKKLPTAIRRDPTRHPYAIKVK